MLSCRSLLLGRKTGFVFVPTPASIAAHLNLEKTVAKSGSRKSKSLAVFPANSRVVSTSATKLSKDFVPLVVMHKQSIGKPKPYKPTVGVLRVGKTATPIDAVRALYKPTATDGKGVTVGVIDTGCGPNADLIVSGGYNAVDNQPITDFADVDEHGTHVAGIIAGQKSSVRGVAPAAKIRAYRVFKDGSGALNSDIAEGIIRAASEGCDILNLSLGGGSPDIATRRALQFANSRGTACFVATGNDGIGRVAYPAANPESIAVAAMGLVSLTRTRGHLSPIRGTSKPDWFVAKFSQYGPEVDLAGPGVDIISTIPSRQPSNPAPYGTMSGTSMATPAVAGFAAAILSRTASVRNMPRNAARAAAIRQLVEGRATTGGLPKSHVGNGVPLF